ncbi:MAG: hypothetical protein JKY53_12555 [Flavobacteriales bacterium]|nr:hypothetical protein [Flavobacteriales bacterium]
MGFSHAGYHGLINTNYEYEYREFWLNKIEAKELDDTHKMLQKSQLLSKIKASSWVMITWGSALYYFLETFIVSVGASLLVSLLFLLKIKPQKETKLVTDGG